MICYPAGMVRFETNPERFNTVKMLRTLESDVENLISLDNHITQMEEEILVNPKYIKLVGSAGGRAQASADVVDRVHEDLENSLSGSARGSRSGSIGPSSSSSALNANNFNFTC